MPLCRTIAPQNKVCAHFTQSNFLAWDKVAYAWMMVHTTCHRLHGIVVCNIVSRNKLHRVSCPLQSSHLWPKSSLCATSSLSAVRSVWSLWSTGSWWSSRSLLSWGTLKSCMTFLTSGTVWTLRKQKFFCWNSVKTPAKVHAYNLLRTVIYKQTLSLITISSGTHCGTITARDSRCSFISSRTRGSSWPRVTSRTCHTHWALRSWEPRRTFLTGWTLHD